MSIGGVFLHEQFHGLTVLPLDQNFGDCIIFNLTFISVLRRHQVIGQFS